MLHWALITGGPRLLITALLHLVTARCVSLLASALITGCILTRFAGQHGQWEGGDVSGEGKEKKAPRNTRRALQTCSRLTFAHRNGELHVNSCRRVVSPRLPVSLSPLPPSLSFSCACACAYLPFRLAFVFCLPF